MYGTIVFDDASSLAEFLKAFVGTTAIFEVSQEGNAFVMKFKGGY